MDRSATSEARRPARASCAAGFLGALVWPMPCDLSASATLAQAIQEQRFGDSGHHGLRRSGGREGVDARAGTRLSARFQKEIQPSLRLCDRQRGGQRFELWSLFFSDDFSDRSKRRLTIHL